MTIAQRVILFVAGGFMLLFAFGSATGPYGVGEGRAWLATTQFLLAVALFFIASRRSNSSK